MIVLFHFFMAKYEMLERNQHSCLKIVKFDTKSIFSFCATEHFGAFLSLNPVITFKGVMI
jgi:hypothetical protein